MSSFAGKCTIITSCALTHKIPADSLTWFAHEGGGRDSVESLEWVECGHRSAYVRHCFTPETPVQPDTAQWPAQENISIITSDSSDHHVVVSSHMCPHDRFSDPGSALWWSVWRDSIWSKTLLCQLHIRFVVKDLKNVFYDISYVQT